jgi:hypothetical protein
MFKIPISPPLIYFVSVRERLSPSCGCRGNVSSVGAPYNIHPAATAHEFVMRIMERATVSGRYVFQQILRFFLKQQMIAVAGCACSWATRAAGRNEMGLYFT